jgi:tetratricopeptide (TPR) repeat protein
VCLQQPSFAKHDGDGRVDRIHPPFPLFPQPEDEVYVAGIAGDGSDIVTRLASSLGHCHDAAAGAAARGIAGDGRVMFADSGVASTGRHPARRLTDISPQVRAIEGLGGIGKSAAARQLCRRLRDLQCCPCGIFWVNGESPATFETGYHDMASQLQLPFDSASLHAARDAVFAWMRTRDGWLIVLDNVDAPEAVAAFMPPSDARGDVVVTTRAGADRLRACGVMRSGGDAPVVLECLDGDTSVSLLCQLCRRDVESLSDEERRAAQQLCVAELGGLPLAIEQAAAYIRSHARTFVDALSLYRTQFQSLFGDSGEPATSADDVDMEWLDEDDVVVVPLPRSAPEHSDLSRRSVRTTWELSMRTLDTAHVTLMRLLCCFGADDMPVDAIVACIAALPADDDLRVLVLGGRGSGAGDAANPLPVAAAALSALSASSLVKWHVSAGVVSMHRLLQTVVWDASPPGARETVAAACMSGFTSALEPLSSSVESSGLASAAAATLRHWLPHADAVQEKCTRAYGAPRAAAPQPEEPARQRLVSLLVHLVDAVAEGLHLTVQFNDAKRLYSRSVDLQRQLCGADADHADVASALHNLASVLRAMGDLVESARLHRASLAMKRRLHGDHRDHREVAASLHDLANVLRAQGKLAESEQLLRESLAMRRRLQGGDADYPDRGVAASLHDLANVLHAQGKLSESARLHDESLSMKRRLHGGGVDHSDVAESMASLASVLRAQGQLTECMHLRRASLEMVRRLHGEDTDHPIVAAAMTNLANVQRALGDLTESALLHRCALAMRRRLYGSQTDHPDVAASLNNLALVVGAQGDVDESVRLHRESLAMKRRLHGEHTDHREVAASLHNLADMLRAQGDHTDSARLHRESLEMFRRLHGARSHADVASSMSALANVLRAMGELAESAQLHRDALVARRQLYGVDTDHADVAASLNDLALVLRAQGHAVESARLHRESLNMAQRLGLTAEDSSEHGSLDGGEPWREGQEVRV